MAELQSMLSDAGFKIPSVSSQTIGHWLLYFGVAILFLIIIGVIWYFLYLLMTYNKKIIVFKKVGGKVIPHFSDKAKFERLGIAGDYWLKLLKLKKILPRPGIEISKNTFWLYEREDGEWINFCLEDVDAKQKTAGAFYVDEDMRLQRLGIQKNLRDRFQKLGFWDKYGAIVMYVGTLLVLTICIILIFNKINDLVKSLPAVADSLKAVAEVLRDIYVQTRGGVVPVGNSTGLL